MSMTMGPIDRGTQDLTRRSDLDAAKSELAVVLEDLRVLVEKRTAAAAKASIQSVRSTVEAQPMASVLGALALGALAAVALTHRSSQSGRHGWLNRDLPRLPNSLANIHLPDLPSRADLRLFSRDIERAARRASDVGGQTVSSALERVVGAVSSIGMPSTPSAWVDRVKGWLEQSRQAIGK